MLTLHLASLAPAALGLCCLAADRRRARAGELIAATIMMLAMIDTALVGAVPPVWWSTVLIATALVVAATRGRARSRMAMMGDAGAGPGPGVGAAAAMGVHAAGGLVVMAALILAMAAGGASVSPGHHHGSSVAGLPAVGAALALAYVIGSIVVAVRARSTLDRVQYVSMATSVAVMSLALGAG